MGYTDRYFRHLLRLMNAEVTLYTEMPPTGRVERCLDDFSLGFEPDQHPLVAQLGGGDPKALARATSVLLAYGYREINLNVGCPSSKVQAANIGAILFKQPELVRDCVAAIREAGATMVTVKTRLGVDELDQYEDVCHFMQKVSEVPVDRWIMHARKAWLTGLNPKRNRTVPPLRYDEVYALKKQFPNVPMILNGGIEGVEAMMSHCQYVDGVMLGRAIMRKPELLMKDQGAEARYLLSRPT